jgi:hypothetical protein
MTDAIKITGLADFTRNIKKLDANLPKVLRLAFNEASTMIVQDAQTGMPTKTGRAKRSIKAKSTRSEARIAGGGARAPHYPWLDFGGEGRVKGRPPARTFIKQGRYLYASYFKLRPELVRALEEGLVDVARQAGIDVD